MKAILSLVPSSSEATSLDVLALPKFVDFEVQDGGFPCCITMLYFKPTLEVIALLALIIPDTFWIVCMLSTSTMLLLLPPTAIFSLLLGFFVNGTSVLIILPTWRSNIAISSFLSYFRAISIATSKSLFFVDEFRWKFSMKSPMAYWPTV